MKSSKIELLRAIARGSLTRDQAAKILDERETEKGSVLMAQHKELSRSSGAADCSTPAEAGKAQGMKHCWKDEHTHITETHGIGSEEWQVSFARIGGACLLRDGHEGPHVFTPDKDIKIELMKEEATPADAGKERSE